MPAPYRLRVIGSRPLQLAALPGAQLAADSGNAQELRTADPLLAVRGVEEAAKAQGVAIRHLEVRPATLEEVFLSLTGHALRE